MKKLQKKSQIIPDLHLKVSIIVEKIFSRNLESESTNIILRNSIFLFVFHWQCVIK